MHPFYADLYERFEGLLHDLWAALDGLPDEALDWSPAPDMNSLTVLVVHVAGATRYWAGDVAYGDISHRDRAAEFAARGLPREALRQHIDDVLAYLRARFESATRDSLSDERPAPGRDKTYTQGWAILHALEHIAVHVGHAQITRQLWFMRPL